MKELRADPNLPQEEKDVEDGDSFFHGGDRPGSPCCDIVTYEIWE